MTSTIYALATAAGRAAVAVVRLSGPDARKALKAVIGRVPPPRTAGLRTVRDTKGVAIDQGLALWFPGPGSYTGEDSAELHLHGGPAVVSRVLETLNSLGLALAEPGEFTRRAFENGKLDLAQAEGVADLIEAETDAQRRQALEQVNGALGHAQQNWRAGLLEALAVLEAAVDFPDEEIPENVAARARPVLQALIGELEAALADSLRGERVREGFRIAIIGAPNAGKSTLLNALVGRDAAIVTSTPGTTRDVIEIPVILGGYKVVLADTAGLRDTEDEIEAEGVRRARAWADQADLRIWVVDGSAPPPIEKSADLIRANDFCLITKADLPIGPAAEWARGLASEWGVTAIRISARSQSDLDQVREALTATIVARLGGAEPPTATRLRHRELLGEALQRLKRALAEQDMPELAAEDVRLAGRSLDRITGRIHPEDVLDKVFASFCIGK